MFHHKKRLICYWFIYVHVIDFFDLSLCLHLYINESANMATRSVTPANSRGAIFKEPLISIAANKSVANA